MFLERFKEVENFTITKLALGGSKKVLLLKFFSIYFCAKFILRISIDLKESKNYFEEAKCQKIGSGFL